MFKVGDVVVCVDDGEGNYLKNGNEYVISDIQENGIGQKEPLVRVIELANRQFFASRFVLSGQPVPAPVVEEKPAAKHIYQVGDKVRIIGNNDGLPGGKISNDPEKWGKDVIVTLNRFIDEVGGYWRVIPPDDKKILERWVYNEGSFELVEAVGKPVIVPQPVLPLEKKEEDMYGMRVPALYQKAKEAKVKNRSKMNKVQLIAALQELQAKKVEGAIIKPVAPAAPRHDPHALGKKLRNKVGKNPGTCSYVVKDGAGEVDWHVQDVCHYRLRAYSGSMVECVLDIEGHYQKAEDKPGYKAFVEYMLNSSPFTAAFTTKSFREAQEHGVYMNCNEPHSNIVAAAVALREASEHDYILPSFTKIKEMGFSEKVAHIACHALLINGQGKWAKRLVDGWHQAFHGNMVLTDLVKTFKEGLWKNKDKPASNVAGASDYRVHLALARNSAVEPTLDGFFTKNFPEEVKNVGWVAEKSVNLRTVFRGLEKLDELLTKAE